jgi:hypothetical protein
VPRDLHIHHLRGTRGDDSVSWRDEASCRGRDQGDWFSGYPEAVALARAVCFNCPVRRECLGDQLDYERLIGQTTDGMFGGRTPYERRVILRHRERVRM